jgi:hypothetical protein
VEKDLDRLDPVISVDFDNDIADGVGGDTGKRVWRLAL